MRIAGSPAAPSSRNSRLKSIFKEAACTAARQCAYSCLCSGWQHPEQQPTELSCCAQVRQWSYHTHTPPLYLRPHDATILRQSLIDLWRFETVLSSRHPNGSLRPEGKEGLMHHRVASSGTFIVSFASPNRFLLFRTSERPKLGSSHDQSSELFSLVAISSVRELFIGPHCRFSFIIYRQLVLSLSPVSSLRTGNTGIEHTVRWPPVICS